MILALAESSLIYLILNNNIWKISFSTERVDVERVIEN